MENKFGDWRLYIKALKEGLGEVFHFGVKNHYEAQKHFQQFVEEYGADIEDKHKARYVMATIVASQAVVTRHSAEELAAFTNSEIEDEAMMVATAAYALTCFCYTVARNNINDGMDIIEEA